MKAIVIGAGIGGLALGVALRAVGIHVEIYERAPQLRAGGSGLGVVSNAVTALESLGIDIGLGQRGQAMHSFAIKDEKGNHIAWLPLPEVSEELGLPPTVLISRTALQEGLLAATGDVPIHLGRAAVGFENHAGGATIHFADGSRATGDVVIGADGINSALRAQITGPEPLQEPGYVCWLAIVPFHHPNLPTGATAHYWGSGQRFGLLDIGHGEFYWWGTKNMSVEAANDWRGTKEEIAAHYAGWADEVQAAIRVTPEADIIAVPAKDRAFLENWGQDRVTLLGDAAHPMLTSLGQGAAMAIEDAVVLAATLARTPDPVAALRAYENQRRDRTRAATVPAPSWPPLARSANWNNWRTRNGRSATRNCAGSPSKCSRSSSVTSSPFRGSSVSDPVRLANCSTRTVVFRKDVPAVSSVVLGGLRSELRRNRAGV